jgi:molybdopterin molybdotransferase
MKPLVEAQREVLAAMHPLREAEVPLAEARGLCLTREVVAPHAVPPFTNAGMDGFAVRSADTATAPVELEVVEDLPAGRVAAREVGAGTASRVMTGAPLPAGADAVVMMEHTEAAGPGRVRVLHSVAPGEAVRLEGSDLAAGSLVFPAGERLTAGHLAVLASIGMARPCVRRRPRVAVLSTGDEVTAPEETALGPGAIRDANRPLLLGLLGELGVEAVDLGIVPDDAGQLADAFGEAGRDADAVISSGGVSVGAHDLVKEVLAGLGGIQFWTVAMQPGKPFAFGALGETPFFGLPGNPVSVTVAFEQLVRPALLHRMGAGFLFRPQVAGRLAGPVSVDPERTGFVRVSAAYRDGTWEATPSGEQGSHVLSALVRADAFAVVPAGVGTLPAGAEVELEMFRWPECRTMEEVLG